MVSRKRVLTCILATLALFGTLAFAFLLVPALGLTSDRRLERQLRSHEATFERLTVMMQEDRNLRALDRWMVLPRRELLPAFTAQREAEYFRLMEEAGVSGVFRNEDGAVALSVSSFGITGSACYKGIAYSNSPLSPTEPSLDKAKRPKKRGQFAYRSLGAGWYLFLRCV